MKLNKTRKSFNDGVAVIYDAIKRKTDFNAQINPTSLSHYTEVCRTFYRIEAERVDDVVFAQAIGKSLDLKMSVPLNANIKQKHFVFVNGIMYDIYRMDPDTNNDVMYLYLMGARDYEE